MISSTKSILDVACNVDTNEVMIDGVTVQCEDVSDRERVFMALNQLRDRHLELLAWAQRSQHHVEQSPRPPDWAYP